MAALTGSDRRLGNTDECRMPWSERFDRSAVGQILISAFAVGVITAGVVYNLPDSQIRSAAQPVLSPFAGLTTLDTSWSMYAPDPIRRTEDLEIHVTTADGSDRMWSFQRGGRMIGPFSWYHWQKVKEQAIRDPVVLAGLMSWVVRHETTPLVHPVHVRAVLKTSTLTPPGQSTPDQPSTSVIADKPVSG